MRNLAPGALVHEQAETVRADNGAGLHDAALPQPHSAAQHNAGVNAAAGAETRPGFDDDARAYRRAVSDLDSGPDDGLRANGNIGAQ